MADAEGRAMAWARPPDPVVEGTLDPALAEERGDHRQDADQPDARQGGRRGARDRARLPDRRRTSTVVGVARAVGASRSARARAGVDSAAAGLGRDADRREQRGRGAQPRCGRSMSADRPRRAGGPAIPSTCPSSAILTGVDGVERVFGNARRRARPVAGERRHSDVGRDVAHLADLPAQFRDRASRPP